MKPLHRHALERLSTSLAAFLLTVNAAGGGALTQPGVGADLVFEEREGWIAVEAEHFYKQTLAGARAWHVTAAGQAPSIQPDGDPPHAESASGGAYLEILPDSRRNHSEELIHGENFSNVPGRLGVLHYQVHFNHPGRYYVWARAYSTGSEDNGIHVGLDGQWPESGQRLQWCEGKNAWRWESKQRTAENHCGEPYKIYLDVPSKGLHEITFSMREDGFEFDKFILTSDRDFVRPEGAGPEPAAMAKQSQITPPPAVNGESNDKRFPAHWGDPPEIQTRDYRRLPGGYGFGSSTLAAWIQKNLDSDAGKQPESGARRMPDGDGAVEITGELKAWHKLTLNLDGPFARERDTDPNPFTDYNFTVHFRHESGHPTYNIPGYFAADGDAGNTSAEAGTRWRAHLSPDKAGEWTYTTSFTQGKNAAVDTAPDAKVLEKYSGVQGTFTVQASDKSGRDFRGKGRLQYVGQRYLRHAGTGEYFLKAGPDAPETLLACVDFDDTDQAPKKNAPLKTWDPHVSDWRPGDPVWKNGKGKGLIGALNYLSSKGVNAFSFLPYNAGGDGDNIWPFVERDLKFHYDCSKLDQWGVVFDHATANGLYLHFKLQEQEIDDDRKGHSAEPGDVPTSLDGGKLGPERKLYCRELIARFAHNLALNWNIGEENTQSTEEIVDMVGYIHDVDPYDHNIVIHTFPDWQDDVYPPLLGNNSSLTGASLQNPWNAAHQRTLKWVKASENAGRPWIVCNDEQNSASFGVPPDPGYQGFDGVVRQENAEPYDLHDIRKQTLWGTLMAGGAGVEYYFGYQLLQNDLVAEDWRSRDRSWDYCRIALEFFKDNKIPFWEMNNTNALIGNAANDGGRFCFAKPGEIYLVYLPDGGSAELDLTKAEGDFSIRWFNPREGGDLQRGSVRNAKGGSKVSLGQPPGDPEQDWLAVVR